jgi:uncharacterized protein YndB with AHSA1/START domain
MTAKGTMYFDKKEYQLTLTRIINAPRELVWQAWTDSKHLQRWWGPKGFTNPTCNWDAKAGNKLYVEMKAPDGVVYPMNGEFREIIKPEKLIFTSAALDKNGKRLFEILNTIVFTEEGNATKLTISAVVSNITPEAAPYLAGMEEGWKQSIDRLEEYVAKI